MLPTVSDVRYWQERRAPIWARALLDNNRARLAQWGPERIPAASAALDAAINSHAGVRLSEAERAAYSLLMILRSMRRRGENLQAELKRMSRHAGTATPEKHRARYARKWHKKLTKQTRVKRQHVMIVVIEQTYIQETTNR